MNILIINHYAGSRIHGMEFRPYYLAREWTKLGHHVTIIAASYSHLRSVSPSQVGIACREEIDGIEYFWIRVPRYKGNGVGRVLNLFSFVCLLTFYRNRLVKANPPDLVIASSTYLLDVVPAGIMAKRYHARLVYEVHDLWPLSLIELGGMSRFHPFILLLQCAENWMYHSVQKVISLLPNAEEHMCKHGMSREKFAYVPNGVAVDEWQSRMEDLPKEHDQVLSTLRAGGMFIVGYAGNFGVSNALDSLVHAATMMRSELVAFVLVGQGPEKQTLCKMANEMRIENFYFLPAVGRDSIPSLLSRMDVLYIGLKNGPLFRFGISPNKIFDYMMAGKPVLKAIDSSNDIVAESGCGLSIPPEDPAEIADAIRRFMDMSDLERETMGKRGKDFVREKHDYRVLAATFLLAVSDGIV